MRQRRQTTREVYAFLWRYYQAHGYSPTQQEIADACALARSGVARHLDKLTIWGWIERDEGKVRSIRPLKPADETEIQLRLPNF